MSSSVGDGVGTGRRVAAGGFEARWRSPLNPRDRLAGARPATPGPPPSPPHPSQKKKNPPPPAKKTRQSIIIQTTAAKA